MLVNEISAFYTLNANQYKCKQMNAIVGAAWILDEANKNINKLVSSYFRTHGFSADRDRDQDVTEDNYE